MTLVLRLKGELDRDALERALALVCERHAALRLVVDRRADGWEQHVGGDGVRLEHRDDGDLTVLESVGHDSDHTPFDPFTGPPIRATLVHLGSHDHGLVITVDHLVCDGWSRAVLARDLGAAYGRAVRRERLVAAAGEIAQFPEVVAWERARESALSPLVEAWRERLGGLPPAPSFRFPFARAVPADRRRRSGCTRARALSENLTDQLRALSRRERMTPFMICSGAFQALLHRYTGESRIVLPTPFAAREWSGAEPSVGWYATRIPLILDVDAELSGHALLARARSFTFEILDSAFVQYARLVKVLQQDPPGGPPAYDGDATFNYFTSHLTTGRGRLEFGPLEVKMTDPVRHAARTTLALVVDASVRPWRVSLRVDSEEVDADTAGAVVDDYLSVLDWLAKAPEQRLGTVALELAT